MQGRRTASPFPDSIPRSFDDTTAVGGPSLRALVKARGISITQFAASVAVSHAFARNWLDGLRISSRHRSKVCEVLQVSDAELTAAQVATVTGQE